MKNERIQIVYKRVDELREYDNNPRKNDSAVDAVAASIDLAGFKVPMVIDSDGIIVAGHTRLKAAKQLGMTEVPCIIADDLTEEQIQAFRLADNKVSELAEWDFAKLEAELMMLADTDIDMTVFGFEDFDLEEPEEVVEDEAPEVDEDAEPITQTGDIWQLGRHRLMCGDSTDPLNIKLLMHGKKADLVFTDPPYGMKKEADGIANDNLNYDDLLEFNKQWIPISFDALKENGSWYCWGIDEPLMDIYSHILKPLQKANKITFRNLITWDKGDAGAGGVSFLGKDGLRSYPVSDEKCLFVMCGGQSYSNNADNYFEQYEPVRQYLEGEAKKAGIGAKEVKEICGVGMFSHWFSKSQWDLMTEEHYRKLQAYCQQNAIDAFTIDYNEIKKQYEEIKKRYEAEKQRWYETRAYFDNTHDKMKTVWEFGRVKGEEREEAGGHATPKPIALCSRAIKSSSREGESVLDFFGGSGSTLITCEQLNRTAYLMELEPKWCDVIVKRWENLTGKKAEKVVHDG